MGYRAGNANDSEGAFRPPGGRGSHYEAYAMCTWAVHMGGVCVCACVCVCVYRLNV